MKTRTEKLAELIKKIVEAHKSEIENLPTRTPHGGANAKNIKGWSHSPNGTITRACNLAGVLVLDYWSGCNPTPASAIPTCILEEVKEAYVNVFYQ
jgi:hypothetical protein